MSSRWTVTVRTKDEHAAGITSNIYIKVHGEDGSLKPIELGAPPQRGRKAKPQRSPFSQGVTSKFSVSRGDCGKVTGIDIWHSGEHAWGLQYVELQRGNDSYRFVAKEAVPSQLDLERAGKPSHKTRLRGEHSLVANGATRFHTAAKLGDVDSLERCITANEFAIDARDKMGRTAAHYASLYGQLDALELLVEFQADVTLADGEGMHCLHHACKNHVNTAEIVELLLSVAPSSVRDRESREENKRDIADDDAAVEIFVRDRDGFGKTACHYAAAYGYTGIVQLLDSRCANAINQSDNTGLTPLCSAAVAGQTKTALCLLDLGAQPDQVDRVQQTFLHLAASAGHHDFIQQVLGYEFSPPVRRALQQVVDLPDAAGRTPLLCAAAAGHLAAVKAVYRAGGNAYHVDADKSNALHLGARKGGDRLLAYLAQKHDVNSVNDMEFTPLHVAVESSNGAAVRWLIKHGADIHAKLITGESALDLARQNGDETLERAMENAEALSASSVGRKAAELGGGGGGGADDDGDEYGPGGGDGMPGQTPSQALLSANADALVPPVPGTQPDPHLVSDNQSLRHRVEHLQQALIEKNRVISSYRSRADDDDGALQAAAEVTTASAQNNRSCENDCSVM